MSDVVFRLRKTFRELKIEGLARNRSYESVGEDSEAFSLQCTKMPRAMEGAGEGCRRKQSEIFLLGIEALQVLGDSDRLLEGRVPRCHHPVTEPGAIATGC